ncbi:MAG: hypothetical protein OXU20_34705 [Myxococcales bacterium]|nr:hypothetical protein [Myxococcales bacterium]
MLARVPCAPSWAPALWTLGALFALAAGPAPVSARELWESEDLSHVVSLDSALKSTWLLSHAPDDPVLFPERTTETALLRLRLSLAAVLGPHVDARVSYEHRARLTSDPAGLAGASLLPPTTRPPFRFRPIDQPLIEEAHAIHQHELDRAWVALHLSPVELTIGRQAIGLGRGALFSAVDVLSPFSPLEVDREWRRGVDAVKAELGLGEHVSAGALAAAERDLRDGALLARVRGYADEVDAELLIGKRAQDLLLGATGSAILADAEIHAESAWFYTDGRGVDGGWLGSQRWVAKFVAGGSYQFDVGLGLRLLAEYHYSGFGLQDLERDPTRLIDPDFQARLARGDSQILGRHVAAVVGSYDLDLAVSSSLSVLVNPTDGSGLVAPMLTYLYSDTVTLIASGYLPWGKPPLSGRLRSEYGTGGISGLLQVRIYD